VCCTELCFFVRKKQTAAVHMVRIDKLTPSRIRELFLGPLEALSEFNIRQIRSMARTIGIIIPSSATIEEAQTMVRTHIGSGSNNAHTAGTSSSDDNNDEQDDMDDERDMFDSQMASQAFQRQQTHNGDRPVPSLRQLSELHNALDSESVNSIAAHQESILMQFINERKAEKMAEELGFASVMNNKRWSGMERKDCEVIKDLAMFLIRIKVILGKTDEFLAGLLDKGLQLASKRLVEHMVGELNWNAAAFVGEADNPMQKAMNAALKAYSGMKKDHKRKFESKETEPLASTSSASNSNGGNYGAAPKAKQPFTCFNCKEVGHISKNCPKKSGQLGNGEGSN